MRILPLAIGEKAAKLLADLDRAWQARYDKSKLREGGNVKV